MAVVINKYYNQLQYIISQNYLIFPDMNEDESRVFENRRVDTNGARMVLWKPHLEDVHDDYNRYWCTTDVTNWDMVNCVIQYGYIQTGTGMVVNHGDGNSWLKLNCWAVRNAGGPKIHFEAMYQPNLYTVDQGTFITWFTPMSTGMYKIYAPFTGAKGPRTERTVVKSVTKTDYYMLSDEPDGECSKRSAESDNDDERLRQRAEKRQRLMQQVGSIQALSPGGSSE